MIAWYNEPDPYAAQWLENLIAAGHIAPGIVDRRPIQEIEAYELAGFTQCHFFAGIGVWSAALRRAGWSDDWPIWTGSCPCQPFSNAGKRKGLKDDRHLWPFWFKLIGECRPAIVIGEQVASALDWFDLVSTDMERADYAIGVADLCAAGFDGAHIRQRLYFVAGLHNAASARCDRTFGKPEDDSRHQARLRLPDFGRTISGLADSGIKSSERRTGSVFGTQEKVDSQRQFDGRERDRHSDGGEAGRMADDECNRQHRSGEVRTARWSKLANGDERIEFQSTDAPMLGRTPVDWLYCRDGKWRPVESGTFPLVNETPARVGRLRAYGNALDLETATQFCGAVREIVAGI